MNMRGLCELCVLRVKAVGGPLHSTRLIVRAGWLAVRGRDDDIAQLPNSHSCR